MTTRGGRHVAVQPSVWKVTVPVLVPVQADNDPVIPDTLYLMNCS